MDGQLRRAVFLFRRFGHFEPRGLLAGIPGPADAVGRPRRRLAQRRADAEAVERAHRVRRQIDVGADAIVIRSPARKLRTSWPACRKAIAAANPPTPPPLIPIFIVALLCLRSDLMQRKAAVDGERLAGDEFGVVRQQERDDAVEVVRLLLALEDLTARRSRSSAPRGISLVASPRVRPGNRQLTRIMRSPSSRASERVMPTIADLLVT